MRRAVLLASLLLAALPALAATSPWDGTWKLDRSRSHFTGETFTYTRTPDGKIEYSNGADLKFTFPTDGTQSPGPFPGTSIAWKQTGDSSAEYTRFLNGKRVGRNLLTLSPDGKTLSSQSTSYRPDGTTGTSSTSATRVAGTRGFEGTWKISDVHSNSPDTFQVTSPAENTLSMKFPTWKEAWEGKLDGTDAPFTGPEVIQGVTLALKQAGDHQLEGISKVSGKPVGYETDSLSPDGKTWTIVSWDAGKDAEKTTAVYARQ